MSKRKSASDYVREAIKMSNSTDLFEVTKCLEEIFSVKTRRWGKQDPWAAMQKVGIFTTRDVMKLIKDVTKNAGTR